MLVFNSFLICDVFPLTHILQPLIKLHFSHKNKLNKRAKIGAATGGGAGMAAVTTPGHVERTEQ